MAPAAPAPVADASELLDRFEQAWRESPSPDLAGFLPDGAERQQALIDLVHIDLEMRARAGLPFAAEDYLARFPELRGPALLDLAAWDYRLRCKSGAMPPLRDFLARFPS